MTRFDMSCVALTILQSQFYNAASSIVLSLTSTASKHVAGSPGRVTGAHLRLIATWGLVALACSPVTILANPLKRTCRVTPRPVQTGPKNGSPRAVSHGARPCRQNPDSVRLFSYTKPKNHPKSQFYIYQWVIMPNVLLTPV